jgi:ankyrin repeat protein
MVEVDAQDRIPLHYAALADDAAAVRTLLRQGATPTQPTGGASPRCTWLAAGAQVDAVNSDGNTRGTPLCSPPSSTAADTVSSSSCYATTEPTHGTPIAPGRPRSA